jgi:hypothetical protein
MNDILEYEYKFAATRLVLGVIVTSGAAAGLGYLASTNDAGLSFRQIVTVSPGVATAIYWVLAALCIALSVLVLIALGSGATTRTYRIRLTPTEFSAPKWSWIRHGETVTVPYSGITGIYIQHTRAIRFLHISTTQGKTIVNEPDIGTPAFEKLLAALAQRVSRNG